LFGEQLPVQTLHEARATVAKADLLLVVGSSLEVVPVSELPQQAQAQRSKIIVLNTQETYIDSQADLVIRHDLLDVLPQLAQIVLASTGV
jgi:NAD-dependent deacetylase